MLSKADDAQWIESRGGGDSHAISWARFAQAGRGRVDTNNGKPVLGSGMSYSL